MQERSDEAALIWTQVAYHLDLSLHLAAAGRNDEAASETAMASALLSGLIGEATESSWDDLPAPTSFTANSEDLKPIYRRAHAVAMEIQAHFVSEGQGLLARAYEAAATRLMTSVRSEA